jgi:hypothetical protein
VQFTKQGYKSESEAKVKDMRSKNWKARMTKGSSVWTSEFTKSMVAVERKELTHVVISLLTVMKGPNIGRWQ